MVVVGSHQWLADIAIQERGTIEACLELAILNQLSITDDLVVGSELNTNVTAEALEIKMFYQRRGLKPATTLRAKDLFNANPTGIDYMIIETDFIVE